MAMTANEEDLMERINDACKGKETRKVVGTIINFLQTGGKSEHEIIRHLSVNSGATTGEYTSAMNILKPMIYYDAADKRFYIKEK